MKKVFGIVVPVVLIIIGIILIVSFARVNEAATQTTGWRQAAGTIDRVGSGSDEVVAYHYKVDGREHPAEQVISTRRDRYRAGQGVIVYVNPARPTESMLEPTPRPSPWRWLSGAFCILIAITLAFYFRLAKRVVPKRKLRRKSTLSTAMPQKNAPRKSAPMSRLRPPAPLKQNEPEEPQPPGDVEGDS